MADTELTWAGLTLGGLFGDYRVTEVEGWDDMSAISDTSIERARGHGDHIGDLFARARIVSVTGEIVDTVNRDALARRLLAATPVSSALRSLSADYFGLQLTAQARVIARKVKVSAGYDVGNVPFAVQFKCPSALRYGAAQAPSTALPLSGGGITYPMTYPVTYGSGGITGRVTVTNAGTAPAPLKIGIRGRLPQGWIATAGDRVLAYPVEVPSGQTVVVNSADGTVLVEGTASRRGNLTRADWLTCPAADPVTGAPGTLDVQFASLGGERDPAALMTVTCVETYW